MLWTLLVLGILALVGWSWLSWARHAEWERQTPAVQGLLELTRMVAVSVLSLLGAGSRKARVRATQIDQPDQLTYQERQATQQYLELRTLAPRSLDEKIPHPWPAAETVFNRHIFRTNLTSPAFAKAMEAATAAQAAQQSAKEAKQAAVAQARAPTQTAPPAPQRASTPPAAPPVRQPRRSALGQEFDNFVDFDRWILSTPSGGLALGTLKEPHVNNWDLVLGRIEYDFQDPHQTVSHTAYWTIPVYRMGFRFRHLIGNLSERQLLFLKFQRALELVGIFDGNSQDGETSLKDQLSYSYASIMQLDKKSNIEHFIIGSYGDGYEEKFSLIREKALSSILSDEHELISNVIGSAKNILDIIPHEGIREMAHQIVGTGGGWATSR